MSERLKAAVLSVAYLVMLTGAVMIAYNVPPQTCAAELAYAGLSFVTLFSVAGVIVNALAAIGRA